MQSETTGGGLRPRMALKAGLSKARSEEHRVNLAGMNPLERLSERLLDWNVLQDVNVSSMSRSEDDVYEKPTPTTFPVLPDVYRSFNDYVTSWEPLMIADIRCGIVSKFFSLVNDSAKGSVVCTATNARGEGAIIRTLDCRFGYDSPGARNSSSSGQKQMLPGVMDLVLISINFLDLFVNPTQTSGTTTITSSESGATPSTSSSASAAPAPHATARVSATNLDTRKIERTQQDSLLGIVVAVNNSGNSNGNSSGEKYGEGGRVFQVHVLGAAWERVRVQVKDSATSVFAPGARRGGGGGQNASRVASGAQPNKVKSYKLFYTVLDSLRSSWREFQALHDLGLNVPLLAEILGAERTFEMAQTPPHESTMETPPGGTLEDPIALSPEVTIAQSSMGAGFSDTGIPPYNPGQAENALVLSIPSAGVLKAQRSESMGSLSQQQKRHSARMVTLEAMVHGWKMKGCTEKFMKYLRLKYNPSQLHAIHTAAEQQGFTLVQGPPGTGKTTTILGILNAIHIREYNQYYKMAIDALLGAEGQRCRLQQYEHPWLSLIARLTAAKPRILVVAPSNGAVDNVVLRLMDDGFVDGNGGKYFPNILRVGSGSKSSRVKGVSLEELTDKEMALVIGDLDRLELVEQLNGQVTAMIKELAFLQTMLVNLNTAFAQCHPLPRDMELRVDAKTGLPVWVDHQLRATSTVPPSAELVCKRGGTTQYAMIEALPDYILYSHRLTQLVTALDAVGAKRKKISSMTEISDKKGSYNLRDAAERSVIDSAHILFTTLNSAGLPSMESTEFCVTVVDEAAQSTEPSVLIALRRGCRQCVMVGDQQQLAATVFSEEARAALYDRSLFQRLVETGHPYIMLDTQYRMHPTISAYPCTTFYEGQLKDGENVRAAQYLPAFLSSESRDTLSANPNAPVFRPFMFFDLQFSKEMAGHSGSQCNVDEAAFCFTLIGALQEAAHRAGCKSLGSVGVITFYQDQLSELRRVLRMDRLNANTNTKCPVQDLDLNTIDAFQGKEKDILIISAVRANDEKKVGFLRDLRRINVALTRAKKGLFVVGHAQTLSSNWTWRGLLDRAVADQALVNVPQAKCDLFGLLRSKLRAPTPTQPGPMSSTTVNAYASSAAGFRGQNHQVPVANAPAKTVDTGRIVVSNGAVGWVSGHSTRDGDDKAHSATAGGAPSSATGGANSAFARAAMRPPDRHYSQQVHTTTPDSGALAASHKRKRGGSGVEEGEVEE